MCVGVARVQAATRTWIGAGADASWDTLGNWNFAGIPDPADSVVFGTAFTSGAALSLNGDRTALDLSISSTATISINNNLLTLTSGNLSRTSASGTQTLASGVILGSDGVWTVSGTGSLVVSGVVDDDVSMFGLTKAGAGTLVLSGVSTFEGAVSVNAGVLNLRNGAALGAVGGGVTIASGSELQLQGNIIIASGEDITGIAGSGVAGAGAVRNVSGNNTWNGAMNLSAATTVASDSGTLTLAGAVVLGLDQPLTVKGAGTVAISGVVSGTGSSGVVKTGTGTLRLTGANTFDGETTVSAGVLNIQNSSALGSTTGKVTVNAGATLQLQAGITVPVGEDLSIAGAGVGSLGALRNVSGNNAWNAAVTLLANTTVASDSGVMTIAGAVDIGDSQFLTVKGSGSTLVNGVITGTGAGGLIKEGAGTLTLGAANAYTGSTTVSAGSLNIQNAGALGATGGSLSIASGAAVQLQGGVSFGTISDTTVLTGAGVSTTGVLRNMSGNNTWNNTLVLSGAATIGSDAGVLTLASPIDLGIDQSLTVKGNGSVFISSSISGTGISGLIKQGAGTLTLTGANTYEGETVVSAGVLNIQHSSALGTTAGNITIASGATLQVLNNITIGSGEDVTSIAGAGVSSLGALRHISGNTVWNGSLSLAAATTIAADAGLLTLAGAVDLGVNQSLTIKGTGNTLISGVISGSGTSGLVKQGTGTLTLTAANTFEGAATISAGVVNIQHSAALGATSGDVAIASGATLQLQGGISVGAAEDVSTVAGTGVGALGAIRNLTGDNVWNGTVTLGASSSLGVDAGSLTVVGDVVLGASRNLTVLGAGDTLLQGVISGSGTSGIIKQGAGTLILSGANTFLGNTTISGGVVDLRHASALGDVSGNVSVATGATLLLRGSLAIGAGEDITSLAGSGVGGLGALRSLSGDNVWNGAIALGANASIGVDAGSLLVAGGVSLGANRTLTIDATGAVELSGTISGSGTSGLVKTGTGTLVLSGANTFNGNVTVNSGALNIRNNTALGNTAGNVVVASGAALEFQGGITIGTGEDGTSVAGVGLGSGALRNVSGNNIWNGTVALAADTSIGSDSGTLTLQGVISGAYGITKVGSGTLQFAGTAANTFTGLTQVKDGRLELAKTAGLNAVPSAAVGSDLIIGDGLGVAGSAEVRVLNSNQIINSADVSIASDGLLALAGGTSETVNAVSVSGGGISVGSGTLALNSSLTLSGASVVVAGGVLSLGGDVSVPAASSASTIVGGSVTIGAGTRIFDVGDGAAAIDFSVASAVTGTGSLIKAGAGTMSLSGASASFAGARLEVQAGTFLIESSDLIGNSTELRLAGGTFSSGGNQETLGVLTLTQDSSLDLGGSPGSILRFADSSGAAWTSGKTLYILGWTGSTLGGGADQLWFGASSGGLNPAQLGQILFVDPVGFGPGLYGAGILPSGEIVPVPEIRPSFVAGLLGLAAVGHELRRRLKKGSIFVARANGVPAS